MNWLRAILREFLGLFVDDGSFAGAILGWLFLAWLVVPHWPALGRWDGMLLFVGLVLILVESAWRTARGHAATRKRPPAPAPKVAP